MTTLDPRSPLVLHTHELGRRPGSMRRVQATVPAPEDLGTAVIGVPAGTPLDLDLRLEAVMEGVLVSGTVRGRTAGECVRCLDEVEQELEVELQELYGYPDTRSARSAAHSSPGGQDDDEERYELQGDLLDLEPVLRNAVVLALPFQPVCSAECPGLCSECGARLADDPGHRHESVDPRWAALQSLTSPQGDQEES
ncbi:MAG: YceD family protein [Actinomycetes bacterium]